MALATPQDVETSLMRQLSASESQYVEDLLERAETILKTRIPNLTDRAGTEPNFGDLVIIIEAESLARVFRNPDAYRQESEGNYSYVLNYQVASGLLDILDRDWERLGLTGFQTVGMQTDLYLQGRYPVNPALRFQYGWGGGDQMSEWIE